MSRLLVFIFLICACTPPHYQVSSSRTANQTVHRDSVSRTAIHIDSMISLYSRKLNTEVNFVIGSSLSVLEKSKPEGTLCNLAADAVLESASNALKQHVNLCLLNYGGLRIPSIAAGNITRGKIFELMPFENEVVVIEVNGTLLKRLMDLVAENGGWPVSGVSFRINGKSADSIVVAGEQLNPDKIYSLATSDYIANGGDNSGLEKLHLKSTLTNIKVRDAIMNYLAGHSPLNYRLEGRIWN